jgi:Protein of unknown function (DUF2380)
MFCRTHDRRLEGDAGGGKARSTRRLLLSCALLLYVLGAGPAGAMDPARLAVFDFELIDSSLQGGGQSPDPADVARLRMVEAELRERLAASGRFELVDMMPAAAQLEGGRQLWNCNGCEVAIARRLDADLTLVGWVQKVSNLILNMNIRIRGVASRELAFGASVDIRGNTDESWRRGIRYLLENRLLKE